MITVEQQSENPRGPFVLVTRGLAEKGRAELAVGRLPELPPGPLRSLSKVLATLAAQVVQRNISPHAVVGLGEYGRVRLEPGMDGRGEDVLWLTDGEPGSLNANGFIARFMALTAFKHMDRGDPSLAADCFSVALAVNPRDAALFRARALARYEVLARQSGSPDAPVLSLQVFGDLLQSINLDPERPETYGDLLSLLGAYRAGPEGEDGRAWISEIGRLAFYKPAESREALAARSQLKEFIENVCATSPGR